MQPDRVPFRCFLVINLPVACFGLAALGLLGLYLAALPHWLPLALAWACSCAAVMLVRDYRVRKREEFFSLCRIGTQRGLKALPLESLKSTPCGRCLLQACRLYSRLH